MTHFTERGAITVWALVALVLVFAMFGLALDAFRAFAAERGLASSVDAAASAGANGIDEAAWREREALVLDPARAEQLALEYLGRQPGSETFRDVVVTATETEVRVEATRVLPLSLTRMFVRGKDLVVHAVAVATPRRSP